jgi:hypothetical protein
VAASPRAAVSGELRRGPVIREMATIFHAPPIFLAARDDFLQE